MTVEALMKKNRIISGLSTFDFRSMKKSNGFVNLNHTISTKRR